MLTKKHFKAIAEILRNNTKVSSNGVKVITLEDLVSELDDYFSSDNPRYDRGIFHNAITNHV